MTRGSLFRSMRRAARNVLAEWCYPFPLGLGFPQACLLVRKNASDVGSNAPDIASDV